MTRASYTSKITGIPRRQETDSSGMGKSFFLTFGSKGASHMEIKGRDFITRPLFIPGLTWNLPVSFFRVPY